jgi:alcohol dehydrogenase class IV
MSSLPQTQLGPGSGTALAPLLDQLSAPTLFLVADPHAYQASGARATLTPAFKGRRTICFDRFDPTPKLSDVEAALDLFQQQRANVIIAIGGGTAIDIAKLVRVCCAHDASPYALCSGQASIHTAGPPLIAIPTTAGTGSEATHFAVVYINEQKYSVAHPSVLPEYALIDPNFQASMPARLTAHTGLDALCQAAESLWSVNSTPTSKALAREALQLTNEHLETAVHHPTPAARLSMCRAANLAGQAINISKTTAPHAISYTLTSHYNVPHGLAVALTLGAVLLYNSQVDTADCNDPRGPSHVRRTINHLGALLHCATPAATQEYIRSLLQKIDCPTRLSDVGVRTAADIEFLASQVNTQRLDNNPRRFTQEALIDLLNTLL